jgi:polygalacturonase
MNCFQSQDVLIQQVGIRSVGLANNDGIDVDSSHSVQILDCDIKSGDDAICLKTTSVAVLPRHHCDRLHAQYLVQRNRKRPA